MGWLMLVRHIPHVKNWRSFPFFFFPAHQAITEGCVKAHKYVTHSSVCHGKKRAWRNRPCSWHRLCWCARSPRVTSQGLFLVCRLVCKTAGEQVEVAGGTGWRAASSQVVLHRFRKGRSGSSRNGVTFKRCVNQDAWERRSYGRTHSELEN